MNLQIVNKNGDILDVGNLAGKTLLQVGNFGISEDTKYVESGISSYTRISKGIKKQAQYELEYSVNTKEDIDFDLILNLIYAYFKDDDPYYLVDNDTNKRTSISFDSIAESHKDGATKRVSTFKIKLSQLFSFWETVDETIGQVLLSPNDSFDIELMPYCEYTPFKMSLTNMSSLNNTKFSFELSNGTKKNGFVITNNGFIPGAIIEIDSIATDGTCILLPELNIKRDIIYGSPFVLYKGTNTITYYCNSAINLQVGYSYRERTII